jgi:hypothetical protein
MQKGQKIYVKCKRCLGTGKLYDRDNFDYNEPHPPAVGGYEEVDCDECDGLGIKYWGWLKEAEEETMPGEES